MPQFEPYNLSLYKSNKINKKRERTPINKTKRKLQQTKPTYLPSKPSKAPISLHNSIVHKHKHKQYNHDDLS